MVTGHILYIMTKIMNKTVRFNLMLHSPSEEASSSTLAPLFLVSGLLSLEVKQRLCLSAKYVAIRYCVLRLFGIQDPLSCIFNGLQAKQEVFFLLIGWIPAVCGSVLSAGRPCGSSREWQSGRGRMQADHSPLCQLLVLWYRPISRGPRVSV